MAKPRDGATVHRTVAYFRRAHGYARIGGVSLHLSSLRYPAPLESPGFVFPDEPVRRDKGPLDLDLFPAHPCSARRLRRAGYSSPLSSTVVNTVKLTYYLSMT